MHPYTQFYVYIQFHQKYVSYFHFDVMFKKYFVFLYYSSSTILISNRKISLFTEKRSPSISTKLCWLINIIETHSSTALFVDLTVVILSLTSFPLFLSISLYTAPNMIESYERKFTSK